MRSVSIIDPHEKAKTAISIFPVVGNVIVVIVDIAEKIFPKPQWNFEGREGKNQEIEAFKERLRKEKDSKIEDLKAEMVKQESRFRETEEKLTALKQEVFSDKNPDIILDLAAKNKTLSEEKKNKQKEIEEKEALVKQLESELQLKRDKLVPKQDLIQAEQVIDKLKAELAAKNAVSQLYSSCLERCEKKEYEIQTALSMLANFRLNDAGVEEYELASRFNTALSKIELFKNYIGWRHRPVRMSFLSQLRAFYATVTQTLSLYESLHTKFPQKDFDDKILRLKYLEGFVRDIVDDEICISQGRDAIQARIKLLEPDYSFMSREEILSFWGITDHSFDTLGGRIRALKTALWNTVRNIDTDCDFLTLAKSRYTEFSQIQFILNEIEDKKILFDRLLINPRQRCIKEIEYLYDLACAAASGINNFTNKTPEEQAKYDELKKLKEELETITRDEQVIESGEGKLIEYIKSVYPECKDYTDEQIWDLRDDILNGDYPYRLKMLFTALQDPR